MSLPISHTARFSDRVQAYSAYRSGFPTAILPFLHEHGVLTADAVVADVGAGTGMLAKIFLEARHRVIAVEPNAEMREGCHALKASFPQVQVVEGQAEATTLPNASVDLITVGRAMHWFDWPGTHQEFARILRPGGRILVATSGHRDSSAQVSEELVAIFRKWRTDTAERDTPMDFDTRLRGFLDEPTWQQATLMDTMRLNWAALLGYGQSLSAIPKPGERRYDGMVAELRELFDRYAREDMLEMPLACRLWVGHLRAEFIATNK